MLNVINMETYRPKDRLLSARDMKEIFSGVSQATLGNWAKKGIISRHKIGGLVFYKESEVKRLIERSKES